MRPGDLVVMDLPSQASYKKIGIVLARNLPGSRPAPEEFGNNNRITYDILVDGVILKNQLYEWCIEGASYKWFTEMRDETR